MGRLSFGHVALIWDGRIIRYGRSERRSRCCSHGGSGASSGGAGAADARRAPVRSVRSKRCGATINGEAPAPRLIAGGCAGVAFCRPATANQYAMDDFGSPHLRATSSGTQTKRQETVTAHKSTPAGTTYGQKRYLCGRLISPKQAACAQTTNFAAVHGLYAFAGEHVQKLCSDSFTYSFSG